MKIHSGTTSWPMSTDANTLPPGNKPLLISLSIFHSLNSCFFKRNLNFKDKKADKEIICSKAKCLTISLTTDVPRMQPKWQMGRVKPDRDFEEEILTKKHCAKWTKSTTKRQTLCDSTYISIQTIKTRNRKPRKRLRVFSGYRSELCKRRALATQRGLTTVSAVRATQPHTREAYKARTVRQHVSWCSYRSRTLQHAHSLFTSGCQEIPA